MAGFLMGAAGALVALMLFRLARWHRYTGHIHRGRHWGWMLRRLFVQLETTREQEKIVNEAVEDLGARGRETYSELEQLRTEVGRAFRDPQFDPGPVRESFARQRALILALEEALTGHLEKIHAALDNPQRATLAKLIEEGPGRSMRHPCRRAGVHHRLHHRAC